ncbi:heat-shock protein [Polaribacter sp. SA4-10]|uniref:Hsp20/alpha crystallin family protein n=1 Tax=Polaribacter sp. SA4-10 TaxID=754397 RepID=UPI000B3C2460|nr:Hsp20/alpha crystallin family protein [Polaribacter sp. SA4-10]ARV06230.1 heat-shock protein [Polaribacter sp. SA4-10]
MSLVKFKNRRRPFGGLSTKDLFDTDEFVGNRLWNNGQSLLENFWNGKSDEPALNIKEEEGKFEIELAAPGFSKKDFEVTVDNGYLNISAEKSDSKKEEEDNYTRKEFSYNSFSRSLLLPENVEEEEIKASYHDGILSFDIVKKEETKKEEPKKIKIA